MKNNDLADRLRALATDMVDIAGLMRDYGGEAAEHGVELIGASKQVMTWVRGIEAMQCRRCGSAMQWQPAEDGWPARGVCAQRGCDTVILEEDV